MINEILYLLSVLISGIILMVRFGLFQKFLSKFLSQKILDALSHLKVNAPNMNSTSDNHTSISS
jgi:hypothetical protein